MPELAAHHAQLHLAFGDPLGDLATVTDQEGDRDIGKLLLEAAQQGRKDVFARNGARAHGQLAHELSLELVHGLSRFALELEDARGVGDEELARARRFRTAPEAIEQPHAQLLLEGADVLRHRGLRQEERFRRLGERLELGNFDEDLELSQVHGRSIGAGRASVYCE